MEPWDPVCGCGALALGASPMLWQGEVVAGGTPCMAQQAEAVAGASPVSWQGELVVTVAGS